MNYINSILSDINISRKGTLCRFFTTDQWINMSHWARNAWFQILTISLFGEIAENTAADIIGHEMIGPCTIAICADKCHSRLYVADKVGVSHIDLAPLKSFQLERMAGILRGRIAPADIEPYEARYARQECLKGELQCLANQYPDLYLAGV